MKSPATPLADIFAAADRGAWLALVEKTLKGAGAETLTIHAASGPDIAPLYAASAADESLAFVVAQRGGERPWDIRAAISHPDPLTAHRQVTEALTGGAASILISIDPEATTGVAIGSAEGLAQTLDGVLIDAAPIALNAGYLGPQVADWLNSVAKGSPTAPLALHLDPVGVFAAAGASPGPIESHVIAAANVAARLSPVYPKASLFLASGQPAHEAGGGAAEELAFAAAAALTYAKALVRAGLGADDTFKAIVLGLTTDGDPLTSIAKLRAARLIWAKITAACGAAQPAVLDARSSRRMLTRADPWINLVRLTSAAFAAAVGGADAIVLGAFTDALGRPTDSALRMARNTQLILMEEGHLGAVSDPAAGSGAFETLTADLARAAWARFNAIEAAGGLVAALKSGLVARSIAADRATLVEGLADRSLKIVGVTDFRAPGSRPAPIDSVQAAATAGPDPRLPGPDSHCPPLTPIRVEELAA